MEGLVWKGPGTQGPCAEAGSGAHCFPCPSCQDGGEGTEVASWLSLWVCPSPVGPTATQGAGRCSQAVQNCLAGSWPSATTSSGCSCRPLCHLRPIIPATDGLGEEHRLHEVSHAQNSCLRSQNSGHRHTA